MTTRILILSPFFPPENQIAAHRINSFAQTWSLNDTDVHVITRTPSSGGFETMFPSNVSVTRVVDPMSLLKKRTKTTVKMRRKAALGRFVSAGKWLGSRVFFPDQFLPFNLLSALVGSRVSPKPDIIFASVGPLSSALCGLFLSRVLNRPLVVDFRDLIIDYGRVDGARRSLRLVALHWCERLVLKNSSLTSSVSDSLGKKLLEKGASNVYTIMNGFDDHSVLRDNFSGWNTPLPSNQLGNRKSLTGRLKIGTVARFHPQKGHRVLIEALGEVIKVRDDWELYLVGEGATETTESLTRLLEIYQIERNVKLLGPISDIAKFYSTLDLHILPSVFGEGFPNVVAESMLAGVPNIVTSVGDAARIVGDDGWVVSPNSPEALREAILEALSTGNNNLREMGKKAKQSVATQFPIEKMISGYQEMYRDTKS